MFSTILGLIAIGLLYLVGGKVIRYQLNKGKYAHLPRHNPKSGIMPSFHALASNGWYKVIESFKGEDGKMMPIMHWGPSFDGSNLVAVTDAQGLREIFTKDDVYIKHPKSYNILRDVFGNGLVTAMGTEWKHQRRLLTPVFHFGALRNMIPIMAAEGENLNKLIDLEMQKDGQVDVCKVMNEATLSVIIRIGFGSEFDVAWMGREWKTINLLLIKNIFARNWFGQNLAKKLPFKFVSEFETAMSAVRNECLKTIQRRREEKRFDGPDLLSLMLKTNEDENGGFSDELMIDECVVFLLAGQDTTSSALEWTMLYLGQNPEAQEKLYQEVSSVLAEDDTQIDVSKLKYAKQVFEEVLRLRGPVLTLRRYLTRDEELCGYKIPKDTTIVAGLGAVSLNDAYWENPEKFDPERFSDEKKREGRNPFAFLPFSAGNRNCIGSKFATQEYLILMAKLVRQYQIVIEPNPEFKICFEVTAMPVGLKAKFLKRN